MTFLEHSIRQCSRHLAFKLAGMLALFATHALAQVPPGTALPNALKDVKPATGVCSRAEVAKGAAGAIGVIGAPAESRPDLSCAVTPAELQRLMGQGETALIDVRSQPDYDLVRIEGALHATVAQLRSKAFLKSKSVVLIGSGKAERELYAGCADLKAQGFRQVKVLQGGVPAWMAHGLPTVGPGSAWDQVVRLSPPELWLESYFDANLVLVESSQGAIQAKLRFATLIPEANSSAIKAVMAKRRKELKKEPLAAVVLVASPTLLSDALLALRKSIDPVPLLVYAGGVDAFTRQMNQQQKVWAAQARGPKLPACGL